MRWREIRELLRRPTRVRGALIIVNPMPARKYVAASSLRLILQFRRAERFFDSSDALKTTTDKRALNQKIDLRTESSP